MSATKNKFKFINTSLIPLKAILFFVFGGLAALHVLNCLQPLALGLNFEEYRLISIIIPFTSILGPLIAGPLADKLAARNAPSFGRSVRLLTAIFLILAAIIYACSFAIQPVKRDKARKSHVSFGCDSEGAIIFQERCTEEKTCFHWRKSKYGSLMLTNCSYTCQNPKQFESLYNPWTKGATPPSSTEASSEADYVYDDTNPPTLGGQDRPKREAVTPTYNFFSTDGNPKVEPPHLCIVGKSGNVERCHVYTADTELLRIEATLRSATNQENETHSAEWCYYPLDGFSCNIPKKQAEWMIQYTNSNSCKPMVECEVLDPYDSPGSVLAQSQCIKVEGDVDATFYGYLVLRIFGDIFPLAALTLLQTATIIATRETSTGRSEISKQFAWGSIGYVLFFPRLDQVANNLHQYVDAVTYILIAVIIAFIVAAVILILASNIPLSPPEWWWHTKTGLLVYPMSAIRKYGPERFALAFITFVLGVFWSSIHSYLPWTWFDYYYITIVGILTVVILFMDVDYFIEYSGHSNILIGAFAVYIVRFIGLYCGDDADWLNIVLESLEPLTLGLTWITIIIYMRHIVPRKYTSSGQAVAIIAHFCLGKGCGALIGLAKDENNQSSVIYIYWSLTISACVIAIVYFFLFHLVLAPRCVAAPQPVDPLSAETQPSNGHGSPKNGTNGNYTPLCVYHNERGKQGQFRY